MYSKTTSRVCSVSLALSLAAALTPDAVQAVPATWFIGSGDYSNDIKWDVPIVPCNAGSTLFQVTIPDNSGTISVDLNCVVDTLYLGDNSTLHILPGIDYIVNGQADLYGIVHGVGGDFTALTAAFPGNRARAYSELGSIVTIGATDYSSTGLIGSFTLFSSTNTESLLDLSSLQNLNAGFNDNNTNARVHTVSASDVGVIDLSGLESITAPVRDEDILEFIVSDTAVIRLDLLGTIGGDGRTLFSVNDGATQDLPALQTVNNALIRVFTGSTLTATGPLWNYSSVGLPVTNTLFLSTNAGSLLDLSSLQNLNAGFNDNNTNERVHTVSASDVGVIDLSGLESITAPVRDEDILEFIVSDTAVIRLDLLGTIGGDGRTLFSVNDGATQDLPALQTVNNALIRVFTGSTLTATGPLWNYSSVGLPVTNTLFLSTNAGSLLDLSSLQNLNAGFNDNNTNARVHTVSASDVGVIDLSGLESITAPVRDEDILEFIVSDTAVIRLDLLGTIGGDGRTLFSVNDGATQDLPALQTVNNALIRVFTGSTLTATGPLWNYSSVGLPVTNTLFLSTNAGSLLDLSSLQNLNAGFNDNNTNARVHTVSATEDAVFDLSRLRTVTVPIRSEDRLDFVVDTNGMMDLSSLKTITGGGQARFSLSTGGELWIGDLSGTAASTSITLNDSDTLLVAPGSFLLERVGLPTSPVSLTAAPDAMVTIAKDYIFDHTDETLIDMESAVVHFNGNLTMSQFVEVGGFDIGTLTPAGLNFGFGQMIVGTDTQATTVYLRDAIDNGNGHVLCGPGEEALYLLGLSADPLDPAKIVNGLRILGGSTLVLNGIPLYTLQDGALVDVRTWFPPGQTIISYALNDSNGFIDLGSSPDTDADNDGVLNVNDNCVVVSNANQRDTNGDGYGNICDPDLDDNGAVQAGDLAILKPLFFKPDPDADFDGNGIVQAADLAIMKKMFFQPPGPSCVAP